jgi:hypothetical protein
MTDDVHADYDDEVQVKFSRDTASTALELLELARRGHHHPHGVNMAEAMENITSRDPAVVIGTALRVIEAAVCLGAGRGPGAFDGRIGVLRETFMDLLRGAA